MLMWGLGDVPRKKDPAGQRNVLFAQMQEYTRTAGQFGREQTRAGIARDFAMEVIGTSLPKGGQLSF